MVVFLTDMLIFIVYILIFMVVLFGIINSQTKVVAYADDLVL